MLTYADSKYVLYTYIYVYIYSLALPKEARPKWLHSTQQHRVSDIAVPNRHTSSLSLSRSLSLSHPSNTRPFLDVFRIWMGCYRPFFFWGNQGASFSLTSDESTTGSASGVTQGNLEKKLKKIKIRQCFIFLMMWCEEFFSVKSFLFLQLLPRKFHGEHMEFDPVSQVNHSQRVHHKHAFHRRRGFS